MSRLLSLSLGITFLIGCGKSDADYIPSETIARDALSASLTSWQSGQALGTLKVGEAAVDTFDARWRDGKKLETFEIVSEIPTTEGPKKFTVKLKMADDKESIEDTYLVVGNNPLLVFRQQDYDKASGMGGGG